MSEEERAIEILKSFKIELDNVESEELPTAEDRYKKILIVLHEENFDIFQTILNLIEKQQKEIEELENRIDLGLDFRNEEIDKYMQENYISKDKIREILDNTEKNIEEDRPSIVLESLILEIKELLGE